MWGDAKHFLQISFVLHNHLPFDIRDFSQLKIMHGFVHSVTTYKIIILLQPLWLILSPDQMVFKCIIVTFKWVIKSN